MVANCDHLKYLVTMSTNKIIAKIPDEIIANKIISLRNKKVMIDSDLAKLYGLSLIHISEPTRPY